MAIPYLRKAVHIFSEMEDERNQAMNQVWLGYLLLFDNQIEEGLSLIKTGLAISWKRATTVAIIGRAYLAEYHTSLGEWNEVYQLLKDGEDKLQSPVTKAIFLARKTIMYAQSPQNHLAIQFAQKTEKLASTQTVPKGCELDFLLNKMRHLLPKK